MDEPYKKILLVAACALVDHDGRILLAQRPEGKSLADFGNFPVARSSRAKRLKRRWCVN